MTAGALVYLIDDDEAVRQSLTFSLATAGLAVRAYDSALAFLGGIDSLEPGCIVSDIRMPEIDGLQLQQRLRNLAIDMPVIIMTGHADVRLAVAAMKAGAVDFIEKPFNDEILLESIRQALARHAAQGQRQQEAAQVRGRLRALSPREREVLRGLVAGLPNKSIAYDLKLSARTVEVHRANVMTKMGASSLSILLRMVLMTDFMA
jgi:two-component system response regulator FixJ